MSNPSASARILALLRDKPAPDADETTRQSWVRRKEQLLADLDAELDAEPADDDGAGS